jgi:hypothetical protein
MKKRVTKKVKKERSLLYYKKHDAFDKDKRDYTVSKD